MEFWNRRFCYLELFFRVSSLKRVYNPDQRGKNMKWNKNKKQKKTLFLISSLRSKMRSGGKISELEKHLGQEKS